MDGKCLGDGTSENKQPGRTTGAECREGACREGRGQKSECLQNTFARMSFENWPTIVVESANSKRVRIESELSTFIDILIDLGRRHTQLGSHEGSRRDLANTPPGGGS